MLQAHLNAAQQGVPLLIGLISGSAVLQRSQELVAVQWHHAVIMVARRQQHGRVLLRALLWHAHVVNGRVGEEDGKVFRLFWVTIVTSPAMAFRQQHIHQGLLQLWKTGCRAITCRCLAHHVGTHTARKHPWPRKQIELAISTVNGARGRIIEMFTDGESRKANHIVHPHCTRKKTVNCGLGDYCLQGWSRAAAAVEITVLTDLPRKRAVQSKVLCVHHVKSPGAGDSTLTLSDHSSEQVRPLHMHIRLGTLAM